MSTIVAPDKGRASYQRIIERVKAKGGDPSKVQQSYLRIHVLASGNTNTAGFSIKKDAGTTASHERKLDVNDAFIVTKLGLLLMVEDPAKPGSGQIYTYPNSSAFMAVGTAGVALADLEIFYSGFFRVKVADRVYAESIPARDSRIARTTQKSSATTFDERWPDDGFQDMNPDFTLDGAADNVLEWIYPTYGALQVQETALATRIYQVLMLKGYRVVGGGKVGQF